MISSWAPGSWRDAFPSFPPLATSREVSDLVRAIHANMGDFDEGDLGNRLGRFATYRLRVIPLSRIDLREFALHDPTVAEFAAMGDGAPPIVWDPVRKSVIDGCHRANAAAARGDTGILAYVGVRE